MNGLLGLNVRTLGVSRDQILSAVRQLGCAWVLVQDDPDLIAPLKALGVKTIYRQLGDETLSTDPATFVRTRAEKGADYVYATNELDPTPEVLAYTMACMKAADALGAKLVIHNFSTDRTASQWEAARANALYAAEHGHTNSLHVYLRGTDNNLGSMRWLALKQAVGGLWLVTEYAFYVDAYHGWRGVLNPAQYGAFLNATLPLFEREQMPALLFSGDTWPANAQGKANGFGVLDNAEMIAEIATVNHLYLWKGIPVTQAPLVPAPTGSGIDGKLSKLPSDFVNVREQPSTSARAGGYLHLGDVVVYYPNAPADGWIYVRPFTGTPGWVSLQAGAVAFTPITPAPAPPVFTFHPPFAQYKIVSHFNDARPGYATDYPGKLAKHEGCDFEPADGVTCDPMVHIGAACTVTQVGDQSPVGYGKFILVDFGKGFTAIYAHFKDVYVKAGQLLVNEQIVGLMGQTGSASEPHVHVTLSNPTLGASGYVYAAVVDPELYLVKS